MKYNTWKRKLSVLSALALLVLIALLATACGGEEPEGNEGADLPDAEESTPTPDTQGNTDATPTPAPGPTEEELKAAALSEFTYKEQNGVYTVTGVKDTAKTTYEIPDFVTAIGSDAFKDCTAMTSLELPEGLTSIGSGAFAGCSNLETLKIPAGVSLLRAEDFAGCEKLIVRENGVDYVDSWVVGSDKTAEEITVREGTIGVVNSAFEYNTVLKKIVMPKGILYAGMYLFDGCAAVEYAEISAAMIIDLPKNSLKTAVITEGQSLEPYSFYRASLLSSVTLPAGIEAIGEYAFADCLALKELVIPNSVWKIGELAFWNCSSMKSVTLPEQLAKLPYQCFLGCETLEGLQIPSTVKEIGYAAFDGCNKLVETVDGVKYVGTWVVGKTKRTITLREGTVGIIDGAFSGSNVTSVTFASTMRYIGNYAFRDSDLTSVVLNEGLEVISFEAFKDCKKLTTLTIPASVKDLGESVFENCFNLIQYKNGGAGYIGNWIVTLAGDPPTVTLEDGANYVDDNVFAGAKSLKVVEMNADMKRIGESAFKGTSVEAVFFRGTQEEWNAIEILGGNEQLTGAKVYFYSETEPETEGNFWRMDGENRKVW